MRSIEEIKSQFLSMNAPFVWALKLTAAEFDKIRNFLDEHHAPEDFPLVMIYVAEWYKRCYDINSSVNQELPWLDAEAVWKDCGFRGYNQWVYGSDRGREWLYSMYVLGGLAAKLECGHSDDRLLEELCRLYHGENLTLSSTGGRAIALARSIENEGSLFYFIQEIITGDFPYAQSDKDNKTEVIYGLVHLLRSANRRALRDKFNCEWIINYADYYETMSRRLKLGLRPERGMNGQRQYLSYERLESWGFPKPETIARIKISLQFVCDGMIVKPADFANPILTYSNTGNDDIGFLAWGNKDAALADNIPSRFFSSVDVKVQALHVDGSLEERIVAANADFPEFLQVYKIAKRTAEWSSRQRNTATAVVYNKSCKVIAPPNAKVVEKRFYQYNNSDDEPKESEAYCWTDIPDSVLIRDKLGVEKRLYNRSGGYEISNRKYEDVISYETGGMVKYFSRNDVDSEWQEGLLPLLFGISGLEIRKYTPESEQYIVVAPGELRFRQAGILHNSPDSLTEGVADLLITLQGNTRTIPVWYIPFNGEETPIIRDFANKEIRLFDGQCKKVSSDNLIVEIERGNELDKVIIPVFSPIEGHEIWIDNTLAERIPINETVQIPFLHCDHFTVKTIDNNGIRITTGEELREGYYSAPDQGTGDKVLLDTVKVKDVILYVFNPQSKTRMKQIAGGVEVPIYTEPVPRHYGEPKFPKSSPFAKSKGISVVDAFEAAFDNDTYFFVFKELKRAVRDERLVDELFIPLCEQQKLKPTIIAQLWRLAFEFHFDWMLLPRSLWEKVPDKYRDKVKDLFLSTPKTTNEYERRQLGVFLENYWEFTDFSTDDHIGKTALKMILGQTGDTPSARHKVMMEIIKDFDQSAVKFHEMTKTIKR